MTVKEEIYKIISFLLDKGVDGFRFDGITLISKDKAFHPLDFSKGFLAALNGVLNNGPHLHEYLQEINQQVLSKYNAYTGGGVYTDKDSAWEYGAPARKEFPTIHFFEAMQLPDSNQIIVLHAIFDAVN